MGSVIPAYRSATVGAPATAGNVNQFLGAHGALFVYGPGAVQASQATASTAYTSTAGLYLTQQFTTGAAQTAIGQVRLQIDAVSGSPVLPLIPPLTVGVYADAAGLPSGSPLGQATVTTEYVYSAPYWVPIPLVVTGLTANTQYHLVTKPVGSGAHYYVWHHSNQTFGASTSTDGVTWTRQSYGLTYEVLDASGTGIYPTVVVEDGGARVTYLTYDTANRLTGVAEYTQGQSGSDYLYSTRTVAYDTARTAMITGVV